MELEKSTAILHTVSIASFAQYDVDRWIHTFTWLYSLLPSLLVVKCLTGVKVAATLCRTQSKEICQYSLVLMSAGYFSCAF